MVLGLLGAGLQVGGTLWGAYQSSKANKEGERILADQHTRMQNYYNGRMAQDYTQRTDVQSMLTKQRDLLNEQYRRARGLGVVGGASDEAVALAKQGANKAVADTMAQLGSMSASYKDSMDAQRVAEGQSYANTRSQMALARGEALAKAADTMYERGGDMVRADDWTWLMGKKKQG